ncbi:MAG: metallophosphoesterase [Candidatus Nanosalina sp.]
MAEVNHSEAVETIARGIQGKTSDIPDDQKEKIAESLMEIRGDVEEAPMWNKIEIRLSNNQAATLETYLDELESALQEGIGEEIEETIENVSRVSRLRERLQRDIKRALNEDKKLEKVAEQLQDSGLGKIAGREKKQINKLGEQLEKLEEKGSEIEELEDELTRLLNRLGIDPENLNQSLNNRIKTIETILENAERGETDETDIDEIMETIIQQESELREAEKRGLQQLEEDIKTLSSIEELEEQEISALRQVENYLQDGDLGEASSTLDRLIQRRKNFGDQSRAVKQIKKDLQEEKKIIIALQKFFKSIKQLEANGVSRDRLYHRMESQGSFSSVQEAKDFFEGLENEFKGIKEDIARVKKLEQRERKLEDLEHGKLKQIDQENSQLRIQASGQDRDALKDIHGKLQELGFSLENDISKSSGGKEDGTEAGDSQGINLGSPEGDAWIISVSDIESGLWVLWKSIKLANEVLEKPLIEFEDDGAPVWAGNNYKFIVNGDMFQHGRHAAGNNAGDQTQRLANGFKAIVNSAESQSGSNAHPVQFTVGNHDPRLIVDMPKGYPTDEELDALKGFRSTYQSWVDEGIVKMIIPGYNYSYVHAGQAHNWTKSEINAANQILERVNRTQLNKIPTPNDSKVPGDKGLAATRFSELQSKDMKIAKLFSAGDPTIEDRTSGDNRHAGMIWARPDIVKNGPAQIVGHTGQKRPRRVGNLIIENTSAKKIPSIVIEKPDEVIAVWRDIESTDSGKINHGDIQIDRL